MAHQPLQQATRSFLRYLAAHPEIRALIKAPPDKTVLYAGGFIGPMWASVKRDQQFSPAMRDKVTLENVLSQVQVPGAGYNSLMEYAQAVCQTVPDKEQFIIWRALSGIFASQAVGSVSFQIGSGVGPDKVFAATELSVLSRNPNVSALTKELVGYYQNCIRNGITAINFGFTAG